MNLFLIGNGFDLAHEMKTSYSDFRKFLKRKYSLTNKMIDSVPEIPYSYTTPDGDERYNDSVVALAIIQILDATEGSIWRDIETNLATLDYGHFLDSYDLSNEEEDDDDDNFFRDEYYRNEDNSRELCGALELISDYFKDWVCKIRLSKTPILDFQNLIDCDKDLFLTFNYTETLEKLYKVKNICHIHGTKNNEIYFGHGSDYPDVNNIQRLWFGAENSIEYLHHCLQKDTERAYRNNFNFFKNLYYLSQSNNINIYSYGFSFSDVDRIYLENIFRNIDTTNTVFYLNDFDNLEAREEFTDKIYKSGFQGEISSFHINKNN